MKKRRQTIDKATFDACAAMIKGGAKNAEVCDFLNLAATTFYRMKSCATFEEFEALKEKEAAKARGERTTDKSAPQIEPAKPAQTVLQTVAVPYHVTQELQKMNALLTGISAKLAYIVEQLS